ncbi:L-histidine N(alpha)-methyltransferase [Saliniramus sp.]|uniref:L-histidine N(alpha)-methyltransferase n=1 Tax=Saliniramus sp. TaxID=2986772 RepID=UPI002B92F3D7|nr:L-histidine N(alpha)-methyltransferase [Saliniramus sp.]HMB09849.1 L-histidine N(alpha)-methyltransferase [Saliniramus sp.]
MDRISGMDETVTQNTELLREALAGLRATPKELQPKWFYDSRGSALFEEITALPEYYVTRTERAVLRDNVGVIGNYVPEATALVELGSGASTKTRILLDALDAVTTYIPVDISEDFLRSVAQDIDRSYPALEVVPLAGDLMEDLTLPGVVAGRPVVGFFPGSTLGNLEPPEARALLRRVRNWPGIAGLILGIDLVKDSRVLVRAYDDAQGVTAAFNRNILARLNQEAGGTFDPDSFEHEARWNAEKSRIEMHLVSSINQEVQLGPETVSFKAGESIHTENSHKYTRKSLTEMAAASGWAVAEFLTDDEAWFAVAVLRPDDVLMTG